MKNVLPLLTALLIFGCQTVEKPNFSITGTINGDFEGYVYLIYDDVVDSTLVNQGQFVFSGAINHPVSAVIIPKGGAIAGDIYFDKEDVQITLTAKGRVFYIEEILGSRIVDNIEPTLGEFMGVLEESDEPGPALLDLSKKYIAEDPTNPFNAELILELAAEGNYFTIDEVNQLISSIPPSAIDPESLEDVKIVLDRMANLKVGDSFPDFKLPMLDGGEISKNGLKGNYVLVDFWASWCAPCIKAMPTIKDMHEKYADKPFKAISISLDQSDELWKRTNGSRVDITWLNALESNGLDGGLTVELGVTFLPYYYLIDKEGKILAINTSLSDAEKLLDKLL